MVIKLCFVQWKLKKLEKNWKGISFQWTLKTIHRAGLKDWQSSLYTVYLSPRTVYVLSIYGSVHKKFDLIRKN